MDSSRKLQELQKMKAQHMQNLSDFMTKVRSGDPQKYKAQLRKLREHLHRAKKLAEELGITIDLESKDILPSVQEGSA